MNKLFALHLVACAALTAFSAPRAPEEEIVFLPTDGQRLVFTFDSSIELELLEMSMSMTREGEEQEIPDMEVEGTLSNTEKIVFTDEVLELEDGRITKLRRTFDEITQSGKDEFTGPDGSTQTHDRNGASELEGMTVVFTWDADDEAYTAAFEDEEGDAELLEDLEGEVDFRDFLPEGPVSKDDTWTVDAQSFNKITSPGGDLHVVREGEEPDEEGGLSDQLEENMAGEITCKLVDVREEDGVRMAVIAVTAKLESNGSEEDSEETEEVGTIAITREVSLAFELEGELLWNLTAGHAAGISLTGKLRYESEDLQELEAHSASMQRSQVFEGTLTHTASVE